MTDAPFVAGNGDAKASTTSFFLSRRILSAFGPWRTFRTTLPMSPFGGEADVASRYVTWRACP
jgi:hypothetical protein